MLEVTREKRLCGCGWSDKMTRGGPHCHFQHHFVRGTLRSCACVPNISFCIFRLLTLQYTLLLTTTQFFSQYCHLSAYHCTARPPNRLPSLHTCFKVEHFMDVVPKFSMKILVVSDRELIQLTPLGLREGYCATRYVMRFSEWNLFDASYQSVASIRTKTHSPLCAQGSQLCQ